MTKISRHDVALALLPGLTVTVAEKLLHLAGSAEELFQLSRAELAAKRLPEALIAGIAAFDWRRVNQVLRWLEQPLHSLCFWFDEAYPALLREVYRPPWVLYIKGDPNILLERQLAIVGSRKPTPRGIGLAKRFAHELGSHGVIVTSGLALGVDRMAHEGALAANSPTIAVLANGLDSVYPRQHQALADSIVAGGGALVSEQPLGTQPMAQFFPQRNRIISGLSLGVLVVEAAMKSGSLVTARLASEQGREVFAVPGDIRSPVSQGCHYLVQNGAKLTTCLGDILTELPQLGLRYQPVLPVKQTSSMSAAQAKLLACFGNSVRAIDELVAESGLAFDQVCSMLLELEIQGYLETVAGGYIRTEKE